MTLRLKITLAFVAAALMGVVLSFALAANMSNMTLAALLAAVLSGMVTGGFGYVFGGALAGALRDLEGVILSFIKWDMDGVVPMPHARTRWAVSQRC